MSGKLPDVAAEARTILIAGMLAGILGGVPSTVHGLLRHGDLRASLDALAALTAMVTARELPAPVHLAIAAGVHFAISLTWAAVLCIALPRRAPLLGGLVAGVLIAFVDLRWIAPRFFPEVAALAFAPQLADHLAWGATVGAVLRRRRGEDRA